MSTSDDLPPPYNQVGSVLISEENFTLMTMEADYLNDATPFISSLENHNFDNEDNSNAGSTETIPSLWEAHNPESPIQSINSVTVGIDGQFHLTNRLVRSLSLDIPIQRTTSSSHINISPSTRSCSFLPGPAADYYQYRHVYLSQYRHCNNLHVTGKNLHFYGEFL